MFYRCALSPTATLAAYGNWGYIFIILMQRFSVAFTLCGTASALTSAPYIGTADKYIPGLYAVYSRFSTSGTLTGIGNVAILNRILTPST